MTASNQAIDRQDPWRQWLAAPSQLAPGSGPDAQRRAMAWLDALGQDQHWPDRLRFGLQLCSDEALTNIITYGTTSQGEAPDIWLDCGPTPLGVALCIRDNAMPFDPTARAPATLATSLDEAEPGGHGLRLMHHYLSQFRYRHHDGCNELWLEMALE